MLHSNVTFLLVEDDEIDVMSVKRAFKKNEMDHPLEVAGNGVEALERLRTGPVGKFWPIVLTDLNMPRMSGIELIREIRDDPSLKKLVVFVLTTSSADSDKIEAYGLNVAGYIVKPVTPNGLNDAIGVLKNYVDLIETFPRS